MSRMMNPGPPVPRALLQARTGERPWPGEAGQRVPVPQPTLVLDVDLGAPLPDIAGGTVTRAWLLMRLGPATVGDLLIPIPAKGLSGADVGAAIAARIGARRRHSALRSRDGQPRSRSRGSTSSL
jgi:hypothetical protein